jgi:glucosyl-dolichyl phosphate glucuronosyltransferase
MAPPTVSIVICTYNRASSLCLTLGSLEAQVSTPDLRCELVLVDNNSSDATQRTITEFAATARIPVRSIFVPRQGLSHARNAGIAESHGEILAFTDDDVDPPPDWIVNVTAAIRDGRADIVGGRIRPRWQRPPPQWLQNTAFAASALAIMEHATPTRIVDARVIPSVWGANMAFRRQVFDTVGVFDPRRGLVGTRLYRGEEIELVQRALAAGYQAMYDPTAVVWHRIDARRMRLRYLSRLHFQRAEGETLVDAADRGRRLIGIPLSRCRVAARALRSWLAGAALQRPDTIERWLNLCTALGCVSGVWKQSRRKIWAG